MCVFHLSHTKTSIAFLETLDNFTLCNEDTLSATTTTHQKIITFSIVQERYVFLIVETSIREIYDDFFFDLSGDGTHGSLMTRDRGVSSSPESFSDSPNFFGCIFAISHFRVSTRRRDRARASLFSTHTTSSQQCLSIQSLWPSSEISMISSAIASADSFFARVYWSQNSGTVRSQRKTVALSGIVSSSHTDRRETPSDSCSQILSARVCVYFVGRHPGMEIDYQEKPILRARCLPGVYPWQDIPP